MKTFALLSMLVFALVSITAILLDGTRPRDAGLIGPYLLYGGLLLLVLGHAWARLRTRRAHVVRHYARPRRITSRRLARRPCPGPQKR